MGDATPVALRVSTPAYGTVVVAASDGVTYYADLSMFSPVSCYPRDEATWAKVTIDSDGLGLIWSTRFEVHVDQVIGLAYRRERDQTSRQVAV